MKRFLRILLLVLVFLIVWELSGIFEYIKECTEYNTNKDIPNSVDMVVALTGGAKRLPEAFKLMQDVHAKHLLISGVDPKVKFEKLAQTYGWDNSYKDQVLLDYASQTTYDNAKITASFVKDFQVKQIVLVTSVYHMKRAHSMFKEALAASNVEIITHSVITNPIDPQNWWKDKSAYILLIEYIKSEEHRILEKLF